MLRTASSYRIYSCLVKPSQLSCVRHKSTFTFVILRNLAVPPRLHRQSKFRLGSHICSICSSAVCDDLRSVLFVSCILANASCRTPAYGHVSRQARDVTALAVVKITPGNSYKVGPAKRATRLHAAHIPPHSILTLFCCRLLAPSLCLVRLALNVQ